MYGESPLVKATNIFVGSSVITLLVVFQISPDTYISPVVVTKLFLDSNVCEVKRLPPPLPRSLIRYKSNLISPWERPCSGFGFGSGDTGLTASILLLT